MKNEVKIPASSNYKLPRQKNGVNSKFDSAMLRQNPKDI